MKKLRPTTAQTTQAAQRIVKYIRPTRLELNKELSERLSASVHIKYEFENPVRSFKIRGALNLVHQLVSTGGVSRVMTASTGNHGAAMAFACQQYEMPLTVAVPYGSNESKLDLIRKLGGRIEFIGSDLDGTKELVLKEPLPRGTVFVEDGSSPEIVAGTSTIGREIVAALANVEVILVPVGNGALIGGVGTAVKDFNPRIKVIGIQSDRAACMALSFQAGGPVDTESCDTFASGMAVRVAIPQAVNLMLEVVDEMILVTETELKRSMALFYSSTGNWVEGAGAAAFAGASKLKESLKNKTICLVASGANVDEDLKQEILENYM